MFKFFLTRLIGVTGLCLFIVGLSAPADENAKPETKVGGKDEQDAFADESAKIVDRFRKVLENSPRRGIALDRVFEAYAEAGRLDVLVGELQQEMIDTTGNTSSAMILGLVEERRNRVEESVAAFQIAEGARPDDSQASYYLAESLLKLDRETEAIEALERAILRKAHRNDATAIFMLLGQIHQRRHETSQAVSVWKRFEDFFPNDVNVREKIATALSDEGHFEEAIDYWNRVVRHSKDEYQKSMAKMKIADLNWKTGRRGDAIQNLEELHVNLRPGSWLCREARRRIESIFLSRNDDEGLIDYYEKWISQQPEDAYAMERMASILKTAGRDLESIQWLGKATALNPTSRSLRLAYIERLEESGKLTAVRTQYAKLDQLFPNDFEILRDWGRIALQDLGLSKEARNAEAKRLWSSIVDKRPNDPHTIAQVAELYRQANFSLEAIQLFKKAIALAPEEPQYREYLGEYYHTIDQLDEAIATWESIVEDSRRNASSLQRLAEIFHRFKYPERAANYISKAIELVSDDIGLVLRGADYHAAIEGYDEALALTDKANRLARTPVEKRQVLNMRLHVLNNSRRLLKEATDLEKQLLADQSASFEDWFRLAMYFREAQKWMKADKAIQNAIRLNPTFIDARSLAAEIAESAGDLPQALAMYAELVRVNPQSSVTCQTRIASIHERLGEWAEALQSGRRVIELSPRAVESYRFHAELCLRIDEPTEAIETLRRGLRVAPDDTNLKMDLADVLVEQSSVDEALDIYWKLFDASDRGNQIALTGKLVELYRKVNRTQELFERLESRRFDESESRAMALCLIEAYSATNNWKHARMELESLLRENPNDAKLLGQKAQLCERDQDWVPAIHAQNQLLKIAPSKENEYRLAALYSASGDFGRSQDILVRLVLDDPDPPRRLAAVDRFISRKDYLGAHELLVPMLRASPDDWELLYRSGVVFALSGLSTRAAERFEQILALRLPLDTMGVKGKDTFDRAVRSQVTLAASGTNGFNAKIKPTVFSFLLEAPNAYSSIVLGGKEANVLSKTSQSRLVQPVRPTSVWNPASFYSARMAALGWLHLMRFDIAGKVPGNDSPIPARLEKAYQDHPEDELALLDRLGFEKLVGHGPVVFQIAKSLAEKDLKNSASFFLTSLSSRHVENAHRSVVSTFEVDHVPPLSDAEIELMMRCRQTVIDNQTRSYTAVPTGGLVPYIGPNSATFTAYTELRRAGRRDEAERMLLQKVSGTKSMPTLVWAINVSTRYRETEMPKIVFPLWKELALTELDAKLAGVSPMNGLTSYDIHPGSEITNFLIQWMNALGEKDQHAEILSILGDFAEVAALGCEVWRAQTRASVYSYDLKTHGQYKSYRGSNTISVPDFFPIPRNKIEASILGLLRQTYDTFQRVDRLNELTDAIETWKAKAPPQDRWFYDYMMASLLYLQDDKKAAFGKWREMVEGFPNDEALQVYTISAAETLGQYQAGLDAIDSMKFKDPYLAEKIDVCNAKISIKFGDQSRASSAIEKVLGLQPSKESLVELLSILSGLQDSGKAKEFAEQIFNFKKLTLTDISTLQKRLSANGEFEQVEILKGQYSRLSREIADKQLDLFSASLTYPRRPPNRSPRYVPASHP